MNLKEKSLRLHKKYQGKIEVQLKAPINGYEDLIWAYSPGVSEPCKIIDENVQSAYTYTSKGNTIAVITDASAVLGLGSIRPEAALPVMEGKAMLLKHFAGINAYPLCLNSKSVEEFISICQALEPSLGGINLEDIKAPECVYIEKELKTKLSIPVFHDDQHGTAIVTLAALINALKIVGKDFADIQVTLSGTGAAGSAIAKLLSKVGVKTIYAYNVDGVVKKSPKNDIVVQELLEKNIIQSMSDAKTLADIMVDSDVFIGVSVGNILTDDMIKSMRSKPIIFALANPNPEIDPSLAKAAGAFIVGTGRSDYPNQINNVLAFPGIFKGLLTNKVKTITDEHYKAAAYAIANIVKEEELSPDYILPSVFNSKVVEEVAKSIKNN